MNKFITVYITCKDLKEAKKISIHLLKKRLVACVNIVDSVHSIFFWPPKKNKIDETKEAILLCHTLESKYKEIEREVLTIHSYTNPALYAIPISHVSKKYQDWLTNEITAHADTIGRSLNTKKRGSSSRHLLEKIEKIARMPNKPMGASEEDKIIYSID